MRRIAKRALEAAGRRLLNRTGANRSGRVLILGYHNVVPDGVEVHGDVSLHMTVSRFREHIDLLSDFCRIEPLDRVLEGGMRTEGKPLVALTFDDAYVGCLRLAVPILLERGFPATVFVAPGMRRETAFWWDLRGAHEAMSSSFRSRMLWELGGSQGTLKEEGYMSGLRRSPTPASELRPADEALLREVSRMPGISFGSHSWSHPNLSRLAGDALREELSQPLGWLRDRFNNTIPWLAYPYGIGPKNLTEVARVGYERALVISGGWFFPNHVDPFGIPRLTIPAGLSANGLASRLVRLPFES